MSADVLHDHGCGCNFDGDGGRCLECGCCVHCDKSCAHECWVTAQPAGTSCECPSCGCEGRA